MILKVKIKIRYEVMSVTVVRSGRMTGTAGGAGTTIAVLPAGGAMTKGMKKGIETRRRESPSRDRPAVVGRTARVEICSCRESVVLSLAGVAMQMDLATVEDVIATLEHALALIAGPVPVALASAAEETAPIPIDSPGRTRPPDEPN